MIHSCVTDPFLVLLHVVPVCCFIQSHMCSIIYAIDLFKSPISILSVRKSFPKQTVCANYLNIVCLCFLQNNIVSFGLMQCNLQQFCF